MGAPALRSVQVVLTSIPASRPGLANQSTASPYSSDWTRESSWANKKRTVPGTTQRSAVFPEIFAKNGKTEAWRFEWAILLPLREPLPENKINIEEKRAKGGNKRLLTTALKHLEPALPEDNSKTRLPKSQ